MESKNQSNGFDILGGSEGAVSGGKIVDKKPDM